MLDNYIWQLLLSRCQYNCQQKSIHQTMEKEVHLTSPDLKYFTQIGCFDVDSFQMCQDHHELISSHRSTMDFMHEGILKKRHTYTECAE